MVNTPQKDITRQSLAISFFFLLKPCQFSAALQTAPILVAKPERLTVDHYFHLTRLCHFRTLSMLKA
jgi:hypothetical protein